MAVGERDAAVPVTTRNFVIYALPFDDSSGGVIALHLLCSRLRDIGVVAHLWLTRWSVTARWPKVGDMLWSARQRLRQMFTPFDTGPFDNPVATRRDLADGIVIYPESEGGNPLGARRVVRWLLSKPGTFTRGRVGYGSDDLYIYFQKAFDDPGLNRDADAQLMPMWINPMYRDLGRSDRAGSCHLFRKGAGRPTIHDADSILLDDLSHEEKAAAFNRTQRFYCYDLYTFYSNYAALCGCIPIVVPDPALAKEDWIRPPADRFGVAYGEEEIDWAIATRSDLIRRLAEQHAREDEMLRAFVARCDAHFGRLDDSVPPRVVGASL